MLINYLRKIRQGLKSQIFKYKIFSKIYAFYKNKKCFVCPICSYQGPFLDVVFPTGRQKDARCPICCCYERHRLQYLIFQKIAKGLEPRKMKILHFAPEKYFEDDFRHRFGTYVSADLEDPDVDCQEDMTQLTFSDESFDVVFASHVLEHIKDDHLALSEIARVLKKTGFAILPVPIISDKTIEYSKANPHEEFHVRCPGLDYFEKYKKFFKKVKIFSSKDFEEKFQVFIYENRADFSKELMPLRPIVKGDKHIDYVPVCYK